MKEEKVHVQNDVILQICNVLYMYTEKSFVFSMTGTMKLTRKNVSESIHQNVFMNLESHELKSKSFSFFGK